MPNDAAPDNPLLQRMWNRVRMDKQEGDIAYYYALSLMVEYVCKLVTAGILSCVEDDPDRHRYSAEHKLVRASGIGEWAGILNSALTGPTAQFFSPAGSPIVRELTQRAGTQDWRHTVVASICGIASRLQVDCDEIGNTAALRQFFPVFATIRNKSRGHGATTAGQCAEVCEDLERACDTILSNFSLFKISWAYLHRNLSGKYRVTPLLGSCNEFEYLKSERNVRLSNGVYIFLNEPRLVSLVFTDVDLIDVFLPNGQFKGGTFEVLSYATNQNKRYPGAPWTTPPSRLPASHTEGAMALETHGNLFANLPPQPLGYIARPLLEEKLMQDLLDQERHPLVTLTGPGGIGKTTLAIKVLDKMAKMAHPPYDVMIWFSARDIDLLDMRAKPVNPRVISQKSLARMLAELAEPENYQTKGFNAVEYFQHALGRGAAGPTLFVLDNFETFENTTDVFEWLDTYVRLPNKVLITTRFRDFVGDYPLTVGGMNEEEALRLIGKEANRLGIAHLIDRRYKQDLMEEADGHPYVLKILLGETASAGRPVKPERIIATKEQILNALFERTYTNIGPGAQRLFLLLSSWRVMVPEVAIEAVLLRPSVEKFDVRGSIEELKRFSLVQEVISETDGLPFLGVPLAAAMFGRRKLGTSHLKAAVELDKGLLMEFGAGRREDVRHGVFPRIEKLISSIAAKASKGSIAESEVMPALEYLAAKVPRTWLAIADLNREISNSNTGREKAKKCYLRFLESCSEDEAKSVWMKVADLCTTSQDHLGEIHALSECAIVARGDLELLSGLANRINTRVYELRSEGFEVAWSQELKQHVERVVIEFEKLLQKANGNDCSRLAWLHLLLGNRERAKKVAEIGLQQEEGNLHCRRIIERLGR